MTNQQDRRLWLERLAGLTAAGGGPPTRGNCMPSHGEVRRKGVRVHHTPSPQVFYAANGEGLIVLPRARRAGYHERWCSSCRDWRAFLGVVAYLQAEYVGCDKCGRSFNGR